MYIAYAMVCLIFGTTFLAIKVGVDAGIPPFFFGGTRFLVAGILIILSFLATNKQIRLTNKNMKETAMVGVLMTTVYFGALYWGEQHISSGLAALLAATTPLIVSIIQWQHKNSGLKIIGMCLGLLGVGVAVVTSFIGERATSSGLGVVVLLLGQIAFAFGTVRSRKTLSSGVDAHLFNAYQMIVGSVGLLVLSALTEPIKTLTFDTNILTSWIYLTIIGSIAGHGLYYWLVRTTNSFFPSTWTYISPIIAQFVGYWWLREELSIYSFVGLSLVLLGVFWINKDMRSEGKPPTPQPKLEKVISETTEASR
ncbi:DMT family transporter [Pelosinus fermentans]|uniref:EamA domain-containing protein n=1 Tax=Pelosinus fermentans B4 TaxID=1149862 RepID=I9AUL7_9FIRM|nr:EamA family transporter [Pelosinus fermentans]EIW16642.1 protein of unknown function DUF6 transmembrane [Pelosinus fermentans B4]EIW22869.1 protein of unknown function DUF6 transmembrane [Pelosinus fermentans A11]